jgi:CheY-like chemotaxis protein
MAEYRRLSAIVEGGPAAEQISEPGGRRVVVVEDSPTVRERHRAILAGGGYDVRTAADGAEALGLLEAVPADAVVTDLEMPAMDGWELTTAIRRRPELAGMGILVVSSRSDEEARRRSTGAGADAYLVKSVEPDRLLGSLARVLDGAA